MVGDHARLLLPAPAGVMQPLACSSQHTHQRLISTKEKVDIIRDIRERGRPVSRTILDVDDELLSEAAKIFGTTTKKATVNAALKAAVDREKRREFADWLKSGGLPDLTKPIADERNAA